jgi:AAA domain
VKLRALELDQFRKFDRPVRVEGLTDGLNLIVGPNEMGKSTVLAALIAALFEKHRSTARMVQSFQPGRHRTAPRVSLDFEVAGRPYRIEKQFLKRPYARLYMPDGSRVDGDDAEAELERLLAFDPAARRSDGDIWGVLWVAQGRSFEPPAFGDGARATLQCCLDAELGQAIGDDHGPALRAAIEAALLELVDRRGKPRARYLALERETADLCDEIDWLEQRAAELEHDFARLDQEQRGFEQLVAAEQAGHEPRELAAARERRDGLLTLAGRVREAQATETIARQTLTAAEQQAAARAELMAALAGAKTIVEETALAAAEAESQVAASTAALNWQQEELARIEAQRAEQQRRGTGLRNLRRLMRQAEDSRAALDARATEVTFALEPDALTRVQIGERPAERRKQTLQAVDPIEIAIEGIGRIDIRPRVAQAARWRRDLADAEHQIAGLLRDLGLTPADDALARSRQLSLFAPRADRPPDAATLEGLLSETERQGEALRAQIEGAEAEYRQRDESHRRQAFAAARAKERVEQAQHEQGRLERELTAAETLASPADLAEAVANARRALEQAIVEVARLSEGDPASALAEVEARIGQLEQAIEQRRARLGELRGSIEGLQARVRLHAGEGFAERLDGARRRLAEAEREHAKCRREVEVLQLLQRTLAEAEREAKERYLAPVVERIRPYLRALFPDAEIALDEALRITSVSRGAADEPFEQLSEGTREQIAILVRLALAELLCDRGLPAVVVLDDALVYSDDERMRRMFEVLERAAGRLQILVLTCRERLFEDLTGTRLHLEPASQPAPWPADARGAA